MFVTMEWSRAMPRADSNPRSLEEIAKRLFLLRKALGYTQAQMGAMAGVSGNAWQNYEAAIRRIELDNVFQLESTTGAPQEWVYSGAIARMPSDLGLKLELARRELEREKRKRG